MRDSKTCKHYKQGDCKRFNPQREYIDCCDCEDYERKSAEIQEGCYGCQYAYWDSYGCTCGIRNIIIGNPESGCAKRVDTKVMFIPDTPETREQAREVAEILRAAETVPVVTERDETEHDAVQHPKHYCKGGIECLDVIKAVLGDKYEGFLAGNVIKYIFRYRDKNCVEDCKKAAFYLEKLIQEVSENG